MEIVGRKNTEIVRDVYDDIRKNIISSEPGIDDVLANIFSKQGKGIRPIFMAFVANLVDGEWGKLRDAAMVIEAIHIASLIHDDVVDGSELRRGKKTLNVRFSDRTSVLYGDFIFVKALNEAKNLQTPEALTIIHKAIERMTVGSLRESINTNVVDEAAYLEIIGDKTAALFAASGELGIILSGANGKEKEMGRDIGEAIGMAFQIIDDSLDFNGDTKVTGKPQYMDLMTDRITLPVIHSLKGFSVGEQDALLSGNGESIEKLVEIVKSNGGIDYAHDKAQHYSQKAFEILNCFHNKSASDMFEKFIKVLLKRLY